jgi:hypothetical protein
VVLPFLLDFGKGNRNNVAPSKRSATRTSTAISICFVSKADANADEEMGFRSGMGNV